MPYPSPLSTETLGHLNYLHSVLAQPLGSWDGFYEPMSPSMNFALRYQLGFASYAVASVSQHTPAYRKPYIEALRGAIEKMLDVAAWGYWRAPAEESTAAAHSGHVAVLLSPHQRTVAGPPSDPVARDNLQYSGHLSAMLGLYEKVSGDTRYDGPFHLADPGSGVSYTYTHTKVAERIHSQMVANSFGGVCCEPGMAYVPCNNHALASNTLHDTLHGTHYSQENARWLRTVHDRMLLKLPSVRGIFGASYVKDVGMAAPVAFNFTDAWGLAFMMPFGRALVRKLYPTFRERVTRAGAEGAYVGSSSMSEKMEISDVPINTGFGLVLAKGMGDAELAGELHRYAPSAFRAGWQGNRYLYEGAPRTLHATSLYALASSIEPGGADFAALFRATPDPARLAQPSLEEVSDPSGRVGVSQAYYEPVDRTLHIELRQVGSPATLKIAQPARVTLTLANVLHPAHVEVNGAPHAEADYERQGDRLSVQVSVQPNEPLTCSVTMHSQV